MELALPDRIDLITLDRPCKVMAPLRGSGCQSLLAGHCCHPQRLDYLRAHRVSGMSSMQFFAPQNEVLRDSFLHCTSPKVAVRAPKTPGCDEGP